MNIQDVYFAKHCVHAVAEMVAREVESQGPEKFSFVRFMEVVQEQLDKVKEGHAAQQKEAAERDSKAGVNPNSGDKRRK